MLNPLCRKVNEVRPFLYVNDINFYAYNPLAGGLLTGKYDLSDPNKFKSRFIIIQFIKIYFGKMN